MSEPGFHQWTCLASPIVSREIINGCGFKPLSPRLFHSNGSLIRSTSYFETIFENPFPPVTLPFLLAVCYNFAKTMQKMANGLFSRVTSLCASCNMLTRRPAFSSPLCFKLFIPSSTGGKRDILYYLLKSLWQRVLWENLKGTMTSYWKITHSTHYQKTHRCRNQGNQPALFYFSKSLVQNATQKKEMTAKAEIKAAQER